MHPPPQSGQECPDIAHSVQRKIFLVNRYDFKKSCRFFRTRVTFGRPIPSYGVKDERREDMERTMAERFPHETDEREEVQDAPDAGDEAILALFFARDEEAIEACRDKYGKRCRAAAESILSSPEAAEECVSAPWLRAWEAIPPERPRYLGAYLAAVTRRLALDRYRAETAEKRGGGEIPLCLDELADAAGDGEPWSADEDFHNRLRDALNSFLEKEKPAARRIFLWRYWYAYPLSEVARLAGKSEGAVKMSLGRTKRRLRKHLEREGFSV